MKNKFTKIIIPIIVFLILLAAMLMSKPDTPQPLANQMMAEQQVQEQQTAQPVSQAETQPVSQAEAQPLAQQPTNSQSTTATVAEDKYYSSKDEVAAYIHQFHHLPDNYITKTKAKKLGWEQTEGNLWDVLPGMSIGGGPFNNYDGKLPEEAGREYKECDIDYNGGARGGKRIVYSNDGLIFYTGDHYETFERLY